MDLTQKSEGDYSPNINIGGDLYVNGLLKPKAGREVSTMTRIIRYLSNNSEENELAQETNYKKAFLEKLAQYPSLNQIIDSEYTLLNMLYGQAYELSWIAEDVGQTMQLKIALRLRKRSSELLKDFQEEPHKVVDALCQELHVAFETNDFDESAIRFFVLSQFFECNVLPVGNNE